MRRAPWLLSVLLLVGSMVQSNIATADGEYPVCDQRVPSFRTPIRLGDGRGYEPSIETDSKGTIYVMAHKESLAAESSGTNTRMASWLWRSTDNGVTFEDMKGLQGGTNAAWALEGDGAVDAKDRFYYVDTWGPENHMSRWSDRGATLDFWKPAVPSVQPLDDRPWVAAHGDGYVYYFGNQGAGVGPAARLNVHRSTDGGQTFDPVGFSFPNSNWGFIDADPNSPYVYAYMDETNSNNMVTWVSPDRGVSWTKHVVAPVTGGSPSDFGFPNLGVSPLDGSLYAEFDNDSNIFLAESKDHGETWTVHNVTPFPGRFIHTWVTVAPNGDVGLLFDADPAAVSGTGIYVYGMIWRPSSNCLLEAGNPESLCTGPTKAYTRLQNAAVPTQEHFIQNEFLPNNAMAAPYENSAGQIMYTQQQGGPSMDGTPSCGTIGKP